MDFIAIDFETANAHRGSACAIGFSFVKDGRVVGSESYLIKPFNNYFDPMNVSIHGITPDMVANSPNWGQLWPEVEKYFDGTFLIAHNAGFDFSVLRYLSKHYSIEHPTFDYCCTLQISKQALPELTSHRLNDICHALNIDLIHHLAESDAKACSEIALHCFNHMGVIGFQDISQCFNISPGKFYPGGYKSSLKTYPRNGYAGPNGTWKTHKIKDIEFDASDADPDGPIYGKVFVFTGKMESLDRIDAQKMVLERGGYCKDGVTKTTTHLVLGEQDHSRFGEGFVSSKTKKAQKYAEEGTGVVIISEWDFMDMV